MVSNIVCLWSIISIIGVAVWSVLSMDLIGILIILTRVGHILGLLSLALMPHYNRVQKEHE